MIDRTILQDLRTRLDEAKGRWLEELPSMLWAYYITPRALTNEMPFKLVFGIEMVILVEIGLPTL